MGTKSIMDKYNFNFNFYNYMVNNFEVIKYVKNKR